MLTVLIRPDGLEGTYKRNGTSNGPYTPGHYQGGAVG